ncbi:MAG: hypothetical protein Ct9H300mP1_17000 [Planctomycetaceae bacterium]|nr:MAG: hypothetical protein Ct9H300mP1_17000 [Planctomycetaceae bacterium]
MSTATRDLHQTLAMTTVIQRRAIVYGTLQDFLDESADCLTLKYHAGKLELRPDPGTPRPRHRQFNRWVLVPIQLAGADTGGGFCEESAADDEDETRSQPAGRASSYLPEPEIKLRNACEHLEAAAQRLLTTPPTALHPYLGRMSDREWLALHLRHAELHMSFVVPQDEGEAG